MGEISWQHPLMQDPKHADKQRPVRMRSQDHFTIWAPRQTDKTWLMGEVKKEIETRYPDQFQVGMMSIQGVVLENKGINPWEGLPRRTDSHI